MIMDKGGRVKVSAVCDSTLVFLVELVQILELNGCTDIQMVSRPATKEEIPEDKPWCNWYYEANGVLPKEANA